MAKKIRCIIKYDIKTEKEAIDFALTIKALDGKDPTLSNAYAFYFPSLNNDTESALMVSGHHAY